MLSRIKEFTRKHPVIAGLAIGMVGSVAIIFWLWALTWLMHWLPLPPRG